MPLKLFRQCQRLRSLATSLVLGLPTAKPRGCRALPGTLTRRFRRQQRFGSGSKACTTISGRTTPASDLDRSVEAAQTPLERAIAYETLGNFALDCEEIRDNALNYFRQALRAYREEGETKRARTLGERLYLAAAPNDSESAALLVQLAFADGDFEIANAFFDTVAQSDAGRARQLLLELEPLAQSSGMLAELLKWLERLVWQDATLSKHDSRQLLAQKARWLGDTPVRFGEAGETWRGLNRSLQ